MRMLVVEDDRKLADFLGRAFADDGWQVDTCRTGADALVQAMAVPYGVIVLDWMLPEGDGEVGVAREGRSDAIEAHLERIDVSLRTYAALPVSPTSSRSSRS